jgi:hypothetical protein
VHGDHPSIKSLPKIYTQLYPLSYPAIMGINTSLGNFSRITNLQREESINCRVKITNQQFYERRKKKKINKKK